jgi:hypothetical protein
MCTLPSAHAEMQCVEPTAKLRGGAHDLLLSLRSAKSADRTTRQRSPGSLDGVVGGPRSLLVGYVRKSGRSRPSATRCGRDESKCPSGVGGAGGASASVGVTSSVGGAAAGARASVGGAPLVSSKRAPSARRRSEMSSSCRRSCFCRYSIIECRLATSCRCRASVCDSDSEGGGASTSGDGSSLSKRCFKLLPVRTPPKRRAASSHR